MLPFLYKVHTSGNHRIVGICDREIVGKEFRDGDRRLFVDPSFYSDGEADRKKMLSLIPTADSANIAGSGAVEAAIEAGFVDPGCVLVIGGVKTAIVMAL